MNVLQTLYKKAYAHNHNKCGMIDKKLGIEDWVDLVFGEAQRFCLRHKFPTLEIWQELDKEFDISQFMIFVNSGKRSVDFEGKESKILLIGNTDAEIVCDKLKAYHIILMHGAKATVKATNRAVVFCPYLERHSGGSHTHDACHNREQPVAYRRSCCA